MAQTQVKGVQIKDDDITSNDIADAAVRGATSNVGTQREIATGTVSTPDLRDDAVTPAKLDDTASFTMGTLSISAGTAAAPGLLITGDVNTGIFSGGADTLSITAGGSERFRVDANGIKVVDGTVGNPSISFLVDPTTGFFRTATGEVAFSSSGTEKLKLKSTGLDFETNQALNLVVHVLASDPGSPIEGQIWYNSTTKQWKGRNDTTTVILG